MCRRSENKIWRNINRCNLLEAFEGLNKQLLLPSTKEGKTWKWKEVKVQKWGEDFFFFAFHFSFSKWLKFVSSLPKWKFSTGKKHLTLAKKSGKNDLAPSEKFSCYAPVHHANSAVESQCGNHSNNKRWAAILWVLWTASRIDNIQNHTFTVKNS